MRFSTLIVSVLLIGNLLSANPAQAETLAEAMEKCRVVSNSLKRLVCYDQLAQRTGSLEDSELSEFYAQRPVAQPPTTQPSADAKNQAATAPAPRTIDPQSEFGLEVQRQMERNEEVSEITAVVGKVEKAPRGKLIITLDDGQVWRQTDSETLRLKSGDSIIVMRGMLGAFYLKKEDGKKRIRVKRSK